MTAARAFCKDRDAALRSLDRDRLDGFLRKWNQPRPREWIGDAWLASMHKARLQIEVFIEAEKAVSRTWLAHHGYTDAIGDAGPLSELRWHRPVKFRLSRVWSFRPALTSAADREVMVHRLELPAMPVPLAAFILPAHRRQRD